MHGVFVESIEANTARGRKTPRPSNERYIFSLNCEIVDPEESCPPPEVRAAAAEATIDLIPPRSKALYDKAYAKLLGWCKKGGVADGHYTESVILAYISELSKKYASTTLWTTFSMLRKTIMTNHGQDLGGLLKVVAFLKRKPSDHATKKSAIFTRPQIERFLKEANNDDFLHVKVVILFGLFGACRKSELAALTIDNTTDHGDHILVKIAATKQVPFFCTCCGRGSFT